MRSNHEGPGGPPVDTVNFHLWQPCNMRCTFCFARFRDVRAEVLPAGHLSRDDAVSVVRMLGEAGFRKITFAGGEPFLCPWLPDLVAEARGAGMTTAIVTNGSLLDDTALAALRGRLDWLVISFDSADPNTLRASGRLAGRRPLGREDYLRLCRSVAAAGITLKINTVVSRHNWREDLSGFVIEAGPARWKVMQVLQIAGQNAATAADYAITAGQFQAFVDRHRHVERHGIPLVAESNDAMIGSYAMVDPAGRFFDNTRGRYTYSDPILSHGPWHAMSQVTISHERFLARGGRYDWTASRSPRPGGSEPAGPLSSP
jgi:radical S-adenosyl methionine domain-containing protein 2